MRGRPLGNRGVVLGDAHARMAGTWTKATFPCWSAGLVGIRTPGKTKLEAIALQGGGFVLSDAVNPSGAIICWQGVATRYQLSKRLIPRNFSTRYLPRASITGIPWDGISPGVSVKHGQLWLGV